MDPQLKAALGSALGSEIASARAISGGDINRAHELALADGRRLFVKTNDRSPRGMFAAEARGLGWLAEAGALRIPKVVAVAAPEDPQQFLVLELVATGAPARDFDGKLGRGLAALHRRGAPGFGLDHDNFIGWLPQANAAAGSWPEFYRARRLEAQLRRAADEGRASSRMRQGFERLFRVLDEPLRPGRAARASARRFVGGQPSLRRSGGTVPHRSGRLRWSPGDRPGDDAPLRRLRRAGLRRLRGGLAPR